MKNLSLLTLLSLAGTAVVLLAQTPAIPSDRFAFDQTGPSLAVVSAYTIEITMDGTVLPTKQAVTCTGTASPWTCYTAIPAVTPGTHQAMLRACETVSGVVLCGPNSSPVAFTMRASPAMPGNVRVEPTPGA
jgi:hypothetical protein